MFKIWRTKFHIQQSSRYRIHTTTLEIMYTNFKLKYIANITFLVYKL